MAFFKFRKQGDDLSPAPTQPESVESMRKRAKYRLIGAAVLVFAGVIGFPLMFDQQPRPIAVDMPVDIPDRNKTTPLTIPPTVAPATTASAKPEPAAPVAVATAPAKMAEPVKLKAPVDVFIDEVVEVQAKPSPKGVEKKNRPLWACDTVCYFCRGEHQSTRSSGRT